MDPASVGASPLTSPATNASVVIQSGKKTTATFTLRYLTTGTGSAEVTVTWPNNAKVAVKGMLSNGTEVSSPLSTTGTTKLSYTGVPTGDYGFDLTLTNPSGTTIPFAMIDMVNIFSGLKSEGTVALVSEDFPALASPAMTASEESSKGDPVYAYRTVTLTAPSGATLYYTTDGTTPSFSAIGILGGTTKEYLAPFDITATGETTIKALSAKTGYLDSAVSNQAFTIIGLGEGGVTIDKPALVSNVIITQADPELAKFTVSYEAEGNPTVTATWYRDSETTAATDTDGDGNQLTFTPTLAEGGRHQVRVNLAYHDGTQAKTAAASLRFTVTQVATPTISNTDTTGGQQITISSTTSEATIYYTTDGTDPTTSETKAHYTAPFNITTTKTVRAVAIKSGMVNSAETSQEVVVAQVAIPVISPSEEIFNGTVEVSMSTTTSEASIYYTTDGSDPTTSSIPYGGPLTLSTTTTVKAIAVKSGMANSTMTNQLYTLHVYTIGSTGPAGGKIFYVNNDPLITTWKYLEAAPADEAATYAYGGYGTLIGAAQGIVIGTGQANTDEIVKKFGATEPYKNLAYAAKVCADKVVAGYDDWFLPSKEELNQMYINKLAIGGFIDSYYWSSTEDSNITAWRQYFGSGVQAINGKDSWFRVRPVRAFL